MRNYKAIVIDGKKIVKCGIHVLLLLIVAGLGLINLNLADVSLLAEMFSAERIIEESFPTAKGFSEEGSGVAAELFGGVKKLVSFVLTFDVTDPRTVIFGEVPLVRAVSSSYLAKTANNEVMAAYDSKTDGNRAAAAEPEPPSGEYYPIKEVDSGQAKALGSGSEKILIRNETTFGINVEELLNEPLKFDMKGDAPKVLIVHTHATESYAPEGAVSYDSGKSDRSTNCEENVVKVGDAIRQVLEEKGISVIHDKTLHDQPNFNGSYENSRKTVERYLSQYPGIQIVLDIHRDAFVYDDGTKAKFVTEIDGKKTAQLMLVIGTNAGGLEHPNWRENMKLALKLQKSISEKYPTLMRGVNLRTERFNGHTTYGSMIIEVGSSGNTLTEAINGAKCGAERIADFLNTLK